MSDYFFSIIIVSWNARHHLETYLPSVVKTRYPDFEIIIADNASNDGTREWVNKHYPHINVVTLDKNYGYCGGNNRAANHADGDILVFLNNDVEVTPDWLLPLNNAFSRDDHTAVVQPKLLSWRKKDHFEYAGAAGGYLDRFGYPFCRGRIFTTVEKDQGQYNKLRHVFWASGAAFAIRKSVFEEQGGFDEQFEFHMEEIDLCWRIWNSGYRILCEPASVVYHLGGGSLPAGDPRKTFYNFRNSLYMLWKNSPDLIRQQRLIQRFFIDTIAFFHFLLKGHIADASAVFRAYAQFFKNKKHLKFDNGGYKHQTAAGLLLCPFSIIYRYYIKREKTFDLLEDNEQVIFPSI